MKKWNEKAKKLFFFSNRNNLTPLQVAGHANQISMVTLLLSMEVDATEFQKDCDRGFLSKELTQKYSSKEAGGEDAISPSKYKFKIIKVHSIISLFKILGKKLGAYLDLNLPQNNQIEKPKSSVRKSLKWSKTPTILSEPEQISFIDNFNKAIIMNQEIKGFLKKDYRSFLHRKGSDGRIPLNVAAQYGHLDTVILLVHKHKITPNSYDNTGKTPLLLAAKYGKLIVLEYLISHINTDVLSISQKNSKNLIHYIAPLQPINDSELIIKILKKSIDCGIDINSKTKKQGYTPTHIAALSNNIESLKIFYFIRSNLQISCLNGMTPIQMAAQFGSYDALKLLLQLGVDKNNLLIGLKANEFSNKVKEIINQTNILTPSEVYNFITLQLSNSSSTNKNFSPFEEQQSCASPRGSLLQSKITCDMFITQNHPIHGLIARHTKPQDLQRFIRREGNEILCIPNLKGQISLHIACQLKFFDIITMLVEKYHVSMDRKCDDGNTSLHIAAENGDIKTCDFLLSNGANPNIQNSCGNIAHIFSEQYRDRDSANSISDIIKLAVNKGLIIDQFNKDGFSPLHIAARSGNTTIMASLLDHNTDIDILSKHEQFTPLQIAAFSSQKSSVRLLRSRGASMDVFNSNDFTIIDNEIINVLEIIQPKQTFLVDISQFHSAICTGNRVETKKLLKKDPKLLFAADSTGSTPLHLATSIGDIELVELFIDRGANINQENLEGISPLFVAVANGSLPVSLKTLKKKEEKHLKKKPNQVFTIFI